MNLVALAFADRARGVQGVEDLLIHGGPAGQQGRAMLGPNLLALRRAGREAHSGAHWLAFMARYAARPAPALNLSCLAYSSRRCSRLPFGSRTVTSRRVGRVRRTCNTSY